MPSKEKLIVALDVTGLETVEKLIEELSPFVGYFKVGLELLIREGAPKIVQIIHRKGARVFLDGKFSDIPNTVARASEAAASLGVAFFDVHASCGVEAMRAAAENKGKSLLLIVTVLTSLLESETKHIFGQAPKAMVERFAKDALECGADGIICSPQELEILNTPAFAKLLKCVPGVRPSWASLGDQKRVMTPAEAIKRGATHLIIGRPITSPPASIGGVKNAAQKILEEMEAALND